jgi:hypothetical protein
MEVPRNLNGLRLIGKGAACQMKKGNFRHYVKANVISLATVIAGIIALILQNLNLNIPGSDKLIPSATLILVILLATSELIDKSKKLDRLESLITDNFDKTLRAVGGATIKKYRLLHDGWAYAARKIREVESTIDHAGLAPPTSRWSKEANGYLDAILKVLRANRVRYRYIAGLSDGQKRLDHVIERLSDPEVKEYRPAYYPQPPGTCPSFSFIIFDRKEVVVYYPKDGEQDEIMISIKQPDLVEMYCDYFQCLWTEAEKLNLDGAKLLKQRIERSGMLALLGDGSSRNSS